MSETFHSSLAPQQVSLPWLIRLRWGGVGLEVCIIAVAYALFGGALSLRPLFGVVVLTALSNLALLVMSSRMILHEERVIRSALILDVLLLTALLAFSGGPSNPFSILYFVHVVIAAVVVGRNEAWAIAALSICCFGLLFFIPSQIHHMHGAEGGYNFHLYGMWAAFAVSALLVAHFLSRLTASLRVHEQELRRSERLRLQQDRLAALTNLAAGAAHELATPLSTIAVTAHELSRSLEKRSELAELQEDATLIRTQVARCKEILQQMSAQAGDIIGEMPSPVTVEQVVSDLTANLSIKIPEQLQVRNHIGDRIFTAPRRGLAAALKSLIKNGLESHDAKAPPPLRLTITDEGERYSFVVTDYGTGMPADVLERIGEPFFSTKKQGQGMGLGVFLARLFAERLGGSLTIQSAVGIGTTVTLTLPKR